MKKTKAYILEFLVIFLSITVAFPSENWRENLQDKGNPCPPDSIAYHFGQIMYHFRWPDVKSTGIGQLRNSKTIQPDSELISAVNNYYTWTEYMKASTPYQYIIPQNDLVFISENLRYTDPAKYRQLEQRLLHLKETKNFKEDLSRTDCQELYT